MSRGKSWVQGLSDTAYGKNHWTPGALLPTYITPAMQVLHLGHPSIHTCLQTANLAKNEGGVTVVNTHTGFLRKLKAQARRRGLDNCIQTHSSSWERLPAESRFDFVLCPYWISKQRQKGQLFTNLHRLLQPRATLLMIEHAITVSPFTYEESLLEAEMNGFRLLEEPATFLHRVAVLESVIR